MNCIITRQCESVDIVVYTDASTEVYYHYIVQYLLNLVYTCCYGYFLPVLYM